MVSAIPAVLLAWRSTYGCAEAAGLRAAPRPLVQAPPPTAGAISPAGVSADSGVKQIFASQFDDLVSTAKKHKRGRRMADFTRDAENNPLQTLLNTWTEGSYSPVHRHDLWAETFVVLKGALAFFTWPNGTNADPRCDVIQDAGDVRGIVVEAKEWHAMTAAPASLGYPGHAVVFETSGHKFNKNLSTHELANFAPLGDGVDGDPDFFTRHLLPFCKPGSSRP
ncbi:unnamed protein product [Prorocentrum cordatum]|uniref:Cupin fold metalloprotein WbuC cupin domain-containing protein n=1 Tax=Prorocentrum cordatum TaxID=2364126 RepID=A0ABN9T1J8_9DINO|nr:unnamed protein product [Polarella glacialis]